MNHAAARAEDDWEHLDEPSINKGSLSSSSAQDVQQEQQQQLSSHAAGEGTTMPAAAFTHAKLPGAERSSSTQARLQNQLNNCAMSAAAGLIIALFLTLWSQGRQLAAIQHFNLKVAMHNVSDQPSFNAATVQQPHLDGLLEQVAALKLQVATLQQQHEAQRQQLERLEQQQQQQHVLPQAGQTTKADGMASEDRLVAKRVQLWGSIIVRVFPHASADPFAAHVQFGAACTATAVLVFVCMWALDERRANKAAAPRV